MKSAILDLTISENKALLKVEGFITSSNSEEFQEKLKKVLDSNVNILELDFSLCKNIGSSGIGKLLIFYKDFLKREGEIEVIKSSKTVYDLFSTIKLNQLFTVNM